MRSTSPTLFNTSSRSSETTRLASPFQHKLSMDSNKTAVSINTITKPRIKSRTNTLTSPTSNNNNKKVKLSFYI
jgi:biotin synthase-related radical SAM superfamily protein